MLSTNLQNKIFASCGVLPISVSIGNRSNKSTWRVDLPEGATEEQKALVQTVIDAFNPDAPTADDVRNEASRRMQVICGARNKDHLDILISNAVREAVRLQNIRVSGQEWTIEQANRAAQLISLDVKIEAIRGASNAMELNPPFDYKDDAHWPLT